jgi:alanyl-tRNA synthetase
MQQQRQRAKSDAQSKKSALADVSVYSEFRAHGETVFCGYDTLEATSRVLGLLKDGLSVERAGAGDTVWVVVGETPLYAESGGQVADQGVMVGDSFHAEVIDVQKPVPGLVSHCVMLTQGEIAVGSTVTLSVDPITRYEGQRAHSATHLIHAALRDTLGPHATQAGSLNRPGYLRLDFSWNQSVSEDAEAAIGEIANTAIRDDLEVTTRIVPLKQAKAEGAMALFGEKYGDVVRMVDIGGPWSRELCAGTHVARSSQIGVISVIGESSVSSTARRIEALVGHAAVADFSTEKTILRRLTQMLKTPKEDLPARIQDLVTQVKNLERAVSKSAEDQARSRIPALVATAVNFGKLRTVVALVPDLGDGDETRVVAQGVMNALGDGPAVAVIGTLRDSRAIVVAAANLAALKQGVNAGDLIKRASAELGGGGGGKPGLAQGGGPEGEKLRGVLDTIVETLGALK